MTIQPVKKIFFFLALPALLIGGGWFAHAWHVSHVQPVEKRIKLSGFNFISPLLDVELPEGYGVRNEPIQFKPTVKKFVDQQIQTGKVAEMSVYYRDLSDGPWFGINEHIQYNPASMMKLPVMVAWLKRAENDKSVFRRKFIFDERTMKVPPQSIKPEKSLESGSSYTVEELLRYMIYFSDNRATYLLLSALTPEEHSNVIVNMNVYTSRIGEHYSTTVRGYSGFLRILYNASFLNKEMSEKALELMSYNDFRYGIPAGVPKGTIIASKFGEYPDENNPGFGQLHEFGIVYHPKGPYILGVMTRGNNWKVQADIIKSVSEIVYNSVNLTVKREE